MPAGTADAPNFVGDYDENKAVLDALMDRLTLGAETPALPDTAMPCARLDARHGGRAAQGAGAAADFATDSVTPPNERQNRDWPNDRERRLRKGVAASPAS